MKKFLIAMSLIISSNMFAAQGKIVSVEFQWCEGQYVCALVYQVMDNNGVIEYSLAGEVMTVEAFSPEVENQVVSVIPDVGRSVAMNVEGQVVRVNRLGGSTYKKLVVTSMDVQNTNAPRPRGL